MAIKCPGQDSEQIILVTDVQLTRTLPLAKGGGVATAGATVTQKDLKEAHEGNAQLWKNTKGGMERYYVVRPAAVAAVDEAGNEIPAPELSEELANARFWYFPSDEGRPGRGLTLPDGVSFAAARNVAAKTDAAEGDIPAAPVAAPAVKPALAAKPAVIAPKAPVAAPKPVAVAPKAPAIVAKPAAAPVAAPVVKKPLGLVIPKR